MPAPTNVFKQRLARGERVIGCWAGFADPYATEVLGTAGFDWLVIDGEHAPNDLKSIMGQLMVLKGSDSAPVVRLPMGEAWAIKQVLDAGAQTLLIPLVESAEQARELVRAMRYPPAGIRGAGAALARASRFSGIPDYVATADAQMCLLVQVETRAGLDALDEILSVDGVDGVFIGPADLAADMGFPGNSADPQVADAIRDALGRIAASDKAAGILAVDDATAQQYADWGAQFLAVGIDVVMLAQAARQTVKLWAGRG
ncbi:HpcH/HpaI aldolase/citrate lyase family protein [Lutimaribacter sp. EGI FJ00015]|uniref:HpcH/HpaI aldolase/citrate lyase family protein n=1 Tax=Lutimaribacter degradans TaxID=2945989 RepID=A0ACC5ZZE6_9RHOB|nr:HpcH/HpaI aldolase/citrate lyase family protein [Lutimaribacter sp. EGI FJ00013]MCM2563121.1 HpcH/HpaI aldolase/citrate lyase family protein [Lutimaribacter sp. EGI FJ00013]MCO0614300.1 HpcH/HpaI aldolase/citrate lyase family protein [Lutimaribacter sp. EGI FJ00015]MCO0637110.1 HpcH/HpaI aldolase/citrate lyase family protein [Lutimaribacter sp. EGI FJ00014]